MADSLGEVHSKVVKHLQQQDHAAADALLCPLGFKWVVLTSVSYNNIITTVSVRVNIIIKMLPCSITVQHRAL